jgi:hypothetical protein
VVAAAELLLSRLMEENSEFRYAVLALKTNNVLCVLDSYALFKRVTSVTVTSVPHMLQVYRICQLQVYRMYRLQVYRM